jgi:cytochrome P450
LTISSSYKDSFERKVLKTITLSNGQVIPAGVILECSTSHNQDDEVFPDASRFDPWRFSKLQEQDEAEGTKSDGVGRHQMVSVTPTHLMFGYGRHACPGRFFAINEIKTIVASFLMKYDMKNVDGSKERYANIEHGISVSTIFFSPRSTVTRND